MNTEKEITVLVVDDDEDIRTLLAEILEDNNFSALLAEDGLSMWEVLTSNSVDVILLDINLPKIDGVSLCKSIRAKSSTPIILLTAKRTTEDRVIGLEAGADDYVCKPFEPAELISRIRSVVRRSHMSISSVAISTHSEDYWFSGWILNTTTRALISPSGQTVSLTGVEYKMLKMFLDNPAKIFAREDIYFNLHQKEMPDNDRSTDIQISRLRTKLTNNPPIIKTIRGEGYVLASAVEKN